MSAALEQQMLHHGYYAIVLNLKLEGQICDYIMNINMGSGALIMTS